MFELKKTALIGLAISSLALSGCLSGGGGGGDDDAPPKDTRVREQQKRIDAGFFEVDETSLPFAALTATPPSSNTGGTYANSSRWHGILNGAGYRVEVPENWNGMLVMYAHGFRTLNPERLYVENPPMRQYLLDNGYAWAASSYSTNFYDVRAGIEDTNALALAFNDIAQENGRPLATPDKHYITGVSMGGHVTAAAVEKETLETANNVVNYDGAAPMCGVVGDTELFNFFAGYTISLLAFTADSAANVPFPIAPDDVNDELTVARTTLWDNFFVNQGADGLTTQGDLFYEAIKNISGGERPIYREAFGDFQFLLQSFAGSDGSVDGVLLDSVIDTRGLTYRYQTEVGEPLTTEEINFNSIIVKAEPVAGANALRSDGLRWIPKVNGEFDVPVVTAHTTGDLFVPFSMEQIYRERAINRGNDGLLVQRAIRSPGHCEFTQAEFDATLDAMLQWEQGGLKPGGDDDDILAPETVADANFGCTYTINGPVARQSDPLIRSKLPPCVPTQQNP